MEDFKDKKEQRLWEILGQYKAPQPREGYVSRFWTKVSQESPRFKLVPGIFMPRPLALAAVAFTFFFILGVPTVQEHALNQKLSQLPAGDAEVVKNLELAQYWQSLDHMDVLKDMEVIEHGDFGEDS